MVAMLAETGQKIVTLRIAFARVRPRPRTRQMCGRHVAKALRQVRKLGSAPVLSRAGRHTREVVLVR